MLRTPVLLTGSPIKMMVNESRMVTAYGDGIHHALHEKPASFMIDTQEMHGDLKVRIEGNYIEPQRKSLLLSNCLLI